MSNISDNRAIKVLHVASLLTGNSYLNNLYDFSDGQKIKYSFVTFTKKGDFAAQLESRGATVYCLDVTKKNEATEFIDIYKAGKKFREIVEREAADIIHTHLVHPTLLGVYTAKRLKLKSVVTRHHSDALHKIPNVITRRTYLALENYVNRNAAHIIAPSKEVRNILLNTEKVSSEKVSLLPYGQTFDRFAEITPEIVSKTRDALEMNGQLSLVCVSRLFYAKGHKYLLEALAPLIRGGLKANLYLVGEGDYQGELEKKTVELEIEKTVHFLGWREDVLAIIASADIIVHPSLEDALSQALIESLMLARPIVATDISGATDTLDGGKYGKLVKPADSASFRAALLETIENLAAAKKKAEEGRKYLLEYMSAERVAAGYTNIYQNLV